PRPFQLGSAREPHTAKPSKDLCVLLRVSASLLLIRRPSVLPGAVKTAETQRTRSETQSCWPTVKTCELRGDLGALAVHVVQDLLQVLPRLPLVRLVVAAQQERGVIGGHHRNAAPVVPLAA